MPPPAVNGVDAQGGGVYAAATSSFVDVTLAQDTATGGAGTSNIDSAPGSGFGGGMSVQAGGAGVVLASDTFATNAVEPSGGSQTGGGNLDDAGPVQVSDTIFTNGIGSATKGNCALFGGQFTDAGHNLESTTPSQCGLTLSSDLVGVDPQLGRSPTTADPARRWRRRRQAGRAARGGTCTDPSQIGNPPLTVDERGSPRHAQCDIGAYETQPPSVTSAPTLAGPVAIGATLTCTATGFAGDAPLTLSYAWLRGGAPIAGAELGLVHDGVRRRWPSGLVLGDRGKRLRIGDCHQQCGDGHAGEAAAPRRVKFTGAVLGSSTLTADGKGHLSISLSCPKSTPGGTCAVTLAVYAATGSLRTSVARGRRTTPGDTPRARRDEGRRRRQGDDEARRSSPPVGARPSISPRTSASCSPPETNPAPS